MSRSVNDFPLGKSLVHGGRKHIAAKNRVEGFASIYAYVCIRQTFKCRTKPGKSHHRKFCRLSRSRIFSYHKTVIFVADKLHILPAVLYDSSSRNVVKMSVSKQKSCRFKGSFRKVRNDFQRIADIGTGGRVNYKNLIFCKRNNPGINLKRTGKNIFHKALRRKIEMNIKKCCPEQAAFFSGQSVIQDSRF